MKKVIIDEFSEYWNKEAKDGHVSCMSPVEYCMIEIFIDWLLKHYHISKQL